MDPGGAELRTSELVNDTGLAFDFLCVAGGAGKLDNDLRSRGHVVVNRRLSLQTLPAYYLLFRKGNYRAVHVHLGLASGIILLLAVITRVPRRIAHFRSDGIGGHSKLTKTLYLNLSRLLIELCSTHILGVSPGALAHGWKSDWQYDRRCRVIPNGFDAEALRRRASAGRSSVRTNVLRIVNVGRPLPEKNRERAIEIWLKATEEFPVDLILVGDVSAKEREIVKAARQKARKPSTLTLIGFTPKVIEEIGMADLLLVTSSREGLPGVILEALAIGVPVVSSDLPGARWIAEHVQGVSICSLAEENKAWIEAICSATNILPEEIVTSFNESPFNQKKVVPQFMEVWGLR
ncbi:glycosyltransferase [Pseudarthrobacter oxydans]|uniref:glycosyltransferase n=1 Tax=Pseudarthrobacter oxydans TaxID=1671 RepID=UPI003F4FCFF0